jgi:hypothetical protein
MQLDDLASEAFSIYSKSQGRNLVSSSIPILFFGDSQKYAASSLKVVTVGLNPSKEEFPDNKFSRFPDVESIYQEILEGKQLDKYLSALNNYFRKRPYKRWFDNSFEPILNGMGASYYDSHENVVLHTDLCSALATDPTWSRLATGVRVRLEEDGNRLWHALIRRLDPDVVIISFKEDYLRRIRNVNGWKTVYRIDRKNPYFVKMGNMMMESKISRIFFGRAAQQPFGTVSKEDKKLIGQKIRRILLEKTPKGASTLKT